MTHRIKLIISVLATCFVLMAVLPVQGQMLKQNAGDLIKHASISWLAPSTA